MRIGLLGDTHGDEKWMLYCIDKFRREGITKVLQLGDLGIDNDQHSKLVWNKIERALAEANQMWFVTPGNHENYDYINTLSPFAGGELLELRPHILLFPRGYRFEWDGISFVSLGGAPSIDFTWRKRDDEGRLVRRRWWSEEFITPEDVAKVTEGGHADVMLAHDAPLGIVQITKRIFSNPGGFDKAGLDYAYEGRLVMTEAFNAVQPEFFFHGHYHFKVSEFVDLPNGGTCHIVGLTANPQASGGFARYALGEFDTEQRTAAIWDVKDDYFNRHELRTQRGFERYGADPHE